MLQSLSGGFVDLFKRVRRRGVITEKEIDSILRDMRVVLLEADVALGVVRRFIDSLKESLARANLEASTAPDKVLFNIAHRHMVDILQGRARGFFVKPPLPAPILLVGLQGSGKTTSCIKLACHLKRKDKKNVAVVSLDVHRPAAREQLAKMADAHGIDLIAPEAKKAPDIAARAFEEAERSGYDALLLDSAGRTHADHAMMDELADIVVAVPPRETLLVVDAAMGQSALDLIKAFHDAVAPRGSIVTRLDGDARGGAMLSLASSQCPVLFIGNGEGVDAFEIFDPKRMASRILARPDLEDIASLVAQGEENDQSGEKKSRFGHSVRPWTFEDVYKQLTHMEKSGGIGKIKSLLSSGLGGVMGSKAAQQAMQANVQEDVIKRQKAMIESMTVEERRAPECIKASRRRRIIGGSGTTIQEINQLLHQFRQMRTMMKKMRKKGKMKGKGGFSPLSGFGL